MLCGWVAGEGESGEGVWSVGVWGGCGVRLTLVIGWRPSARWIYKQGPCFIADCVIGCICDGKLRGYFCSECIACGYELRGIAWLAVAIVWVIALPIAFRLRVACL